jgi:hypothetical protein
MHLGNYFNKQTKMMDIRNDSIDIPNIVPKIADLFFVKAGKY